MKTQQPIGALGFLVTGETENSARGNYGIRDQQLALRWVKKNIRAFGGNPRKITLVGQSAGGWSVITHLMLKKSKNLFHQAIIQSAPLGKPFQTYSEALQQGKEVSVRLGCDHDDMKCLRSKSPEDIVESQVIPNPALDQFIDSLIPWVPFVDGKEIPMKVLSAAEDGFISNKPMIIGVTEDEGIFIAYAAFPNPLPAAILAGLIQGWKGKGDDADAIISKYAPRNISDARPELNDFGTEGVFVCASLKFANIIAGRGKMYVYVFNQSLPMKDNTRTPCTTNSCHFSDLPYVFNSFDKIGLSPTSKERAFSKQMVRYWTNFAKNGSPNGYEMPKWPRFRRRERYRVLLLKSGNIRVVSNYRKDSCTFWDDIGYE